MKLGGSQAGSRSGMVERGASAARTVLAVDDEVDMLENLVRIFRRSPYACVTAASVPEALALLEDCPPDVVLTDLRMPGMDGLAFLRETKRVAPDVPVVVLTAYASEDVARQALEAGAFRLVGKPFTASELLRTIDETLASLRARERSAAPPAAQDSPIGVSVARGGTAGES